MLVSWTVAYTSELRLCIQYTCITLMQHVYVFIHDIETFIQSTKIYVPGTYVTGVRYILCAWLMPLPYCGSTSVPCVCIAVSMGTA